MGSLFDIKAAPKKPKKCRTTGRPRDAQRSKVYAAERRAFPDFERDMLTKEECKNFVDRLMESPWVVNRWGRRKVWVEFRESRRASGSPLGWIRLPSWARNPWVILHEIAHVVAPAADEGHGAEYCSVYLDLIRHRMGGADGDRLKREFVLGGVKHRVTKTTKPKESLSQVITEAPLTKQEALMTAEKLRRGVAQGLFGGGSNRIRLAALSVAVKLEEWAAEPWSEEDLDYARKWKKRAGVAGS